MSHKVSYALKVHLFIVGLFAFSPASAFFSQYYFKQLSIDDGLSSSRVQALCFDHKGYVWIGTQWGLNCYDKDHITPFYADPSQSNALPSNDILFVVEDRHNNLWVGTNKGLVTYNRYESNFERIAYEGRDLDVYSYLLTSDGILFGGVSQIYKYSYQSKEISRLPMHLSKSVYHAFVQMESYDEETIFINTRWYGIFTYNLSTGELRKLDYVIQGKTTILYIDSLQQVWVSYYGKGVICYKNGQLLRSFTSKNSELTCDVVLDMVERDGSLWLATDGGGINIVSVHDFTFSQGLYHTDDLSSFPDNAIYKLYKDTKNNIWAGTIRNGLVGIRKVFAKSYTSMPFNNKYGLSNRTVNCFFQDEAGVVWIGTDGEGLNAFYPAKKEFKHYKSLKGKKVVSITRFDKNELLLYLFNKGFVIFNTQTEQIRPFIIVNQEINQQIYTDGYSVCALYLESGDILISTDHIYLYNRVSSKFEIIASKGKDYKRNSPQIRKLDDQNICFIDTDAIYIYNLRTKEFKLEWEGKRLITDMCIDPQNNFWIGTNEGLVFYNKSTRITQNMETDLFQGVKSLVADKNGNIWIGSSSNSLFAYTTETNQFALLGESHGIKSNEYLFGATLVAKDSTVYVGGTTGMTHINADLSLYTNVDSSIKLVDVFINDQPIKQEGDEWPLVRLPWNYSSLNLKVLVDEEDLFRKHVFKYLLTYNGEVKEVKSFNHTYTLNNMPHGTYQIGVSYISPNGEWSVPKHLLTIEVLVPWWKSWWFVGICFVFFLSLLVLGLMEMEKRREMHKAEELELLKNEVYEEKIRFLTNISHELRTPLTLIYSPLKRILSQSTYDEKLEDQLRLIYQQSLQMKDMIDMVLDIKKLEDGKEVLSISRVVFNDWVAEVVAQFQTELGHKDIILSTFFDEGIGTVAFDPNKCFFVLQNLLMNALKFSSSHTRIEVRTMLVSEKSVRLEIKDEGIGLDHVDIDRLFSRYYQGKHNRGGSGVGLSYAKSLIELHGGKIGALNNEGLGATFYFELPLNLDIIEPHTSLVPKAVNIEHVDLSYLKKYSLLIIEDVDDMRNYIIESLSPYFGKIYSAKDGFEGLIQVRQQHPDIIICDVMMPRMDGFQFCSTVKADNEIAHIPIIMLTAYTDSSNLSTAYKLGADVILSKPFDLDVLLSLIDNQLKLRKQIKTQYVNPESLIQVDTDLNNADEHFLKTLNKLIDDELGNTNLDVGFLTDRLGVSRSLLYNKVKEFTDMGIIDLINSRRIDKAVELLKNSSLNINEISEQVGFSTSRYFSRVFKKHMGESPTQYRKSIES